eukprot:TRINITY_DN36651_c0_g1_i1.p1 TRINITY_DN36651_c0_g1~~TRINITY_DN36651_c0_g1_i1.p1  ORF type:complete len:107 (-),score=7.23 TRINITY_DN36651_c0_g1_i1:608-928(-)
MCRYVKKKSKKIKRRRKCKEEGHRQTAHDKNYFVTSGVTGEGRAADTFLNLVYISSADSKLTTTPNNKFVLFHFSFIPFFFATYFYYYLTTWISFQDRVMFNISDR